LCLAVSDIDWIIDDSSDNYVTATTYGRTPVTRVVMSKTDNGGQVALQDLQTAIAAVPATEKCG
jgi:hypothetical protein